MDDLYKKYAEGKLSQEELTAFMQEVGTTSDEKLWALMQLNHGDEAEEKLPEDVKARQMAFFEKQIKPDEGYHLWRYVAAIIVIFLSTTLGYWYFYSHTQHPPMTEVAVAPGDKVTLRLPDGSKVKLNSGSLLQYAVVQGKYREVKLIRGEAFFDVAKDPTCPFHVSVNDMNIEVLGTTFNVRSLANRVETSLFTGSVKLSVGQEKKVYEMKPGEKTTYNISQNKVIATKADKMLDAGWKDGYLAFKSAPLQEVITQIEQWYGVKIRLIDKKIGKDLLTGSFRNETLESVLKSLSIQYGFVYESLQDEIQVKTR